MDKPLILLLAAKDFGIEVKRNGDKLDVKAPKGHSLVEQLKKHKKDVLDLLSQLDSRLQAGQKWLVEAHKAISSGGSSKSIEIFALRLDLWDMLDSLVDPRHCPIGPTGCIPESPVNCRSCSRAL
jgi:hypothetical protein